MGKNIFTQVAVAETTFDSISEGRSQLRIDEVIEMYPNGVTIEEFDIVETEDKKFSILNFSEDRKAFFYGGTVLTHMCESWCKKLGKDCAETSKELKEAGGVKIRLSRRKSKNGRQYVAVTVIEEE